MIYFKSTLCAVLSTSLLVMSFSDATPVTNHTISKRGLAVPIMGGVNFPDPAVIRTSSGWHLFSTNALVDGKWIHVQRASTTDWKTFKFHRGVDALPKLPSWVAASPRVWAPDVSVLPDGTFIMYYTAAIKSSPSIHCLSFATAAKITDPFIDSSSAPWICPSKSGGAIDISSFTDEKHPPPPSANNKKPPFRRYIVYKIDGNAIGHGGACGNTVKPIIPTPLLLQEVSPHDGHTLINGPPIPLLTNSLISDGPYIEAPSLTFFNGKFLLFFSSNCYTSEKYDVQYATAENIRGPYTRQGQILRSHGPFGLLAPGGLDVAINGERVVWHAGKNPRREVFVGRLQVKKGSGGGQVEIVL